MVQTKYFIKITIYETATIPIEVVYYRSGFSMDFLNRWKWYFEYLAAIVKVKNPSLSVKLVTGSQELLIGQDYIDQKSKTLLRAKKSQFKKLQSTSTESDLFGADTQKRSEKMSKLQIEIEALERGEFNYWFPVHYINKLKKWTSNHPTIIK